MKKQIQVILTMIVITAMLLSVCVSAASEYITATKAENPPVAMKITWNGESGQAEVYVRPVGEAKSDTYDGLYDFHNIGGRNGFYNPRVYMPIIVSLNFVLVVQPY